MTPVWLDRQVLLVLHGESLVEHGGLSGLRDAGGLDSALARPRNALAYGEAGDIFDLAAAYAGGIVRNHPFADGNKRAAFIAAFTFLLVNGVDLTVAEEEAVTTMLALAAGDLSEATFAAWLRGNADVQPG